MRLVLRYLTRLLDTGISEDDLEILRIQSRHWPEVAEAMRQEALAHQLGQVTCERFYEEDHAPDSLPCKRCGAAL